MPEPGPPPPRYPETSPRVLILRPARQAVAFARVCREAGFHPVELPGLVIEALPPTAPVPSRGVVIFTSVNAVHHAGSVAPLPWPSVQVHAIGPATDAALQAAGQTTASVPTAPYTSEALTDRLLAEPQALVDGISIVTGAGGRGLMAERLRHAGLTVHELAVYRRTCPQMSTQALEQRLTPLPDIICVPSNEALNNLLSMGGRAMPQLLELPLILNNERARHHARALGFTGGVHVIESAGDAAQLDALLHWRLVEHDKLRESIPR